MFQPVETLMKLAHELFFDLLFGLFHLDLIVDITAKESRLHVHLLEMQILLGHQPEYDSDRHELD